MYNSSMLYYSNNNFERAYQLKRICQEQGSLLINVNDCVDLFIKLSQLKSSVLFMDLAQFTHINEIVSEIRGSGEASLQNLKIVGIRDGNDETEIISKGVMIVSMGNITEFLKGLKVEEVTETRMIFQNFKLDYTKLISESLLSLGINPKHTGYLYLKSIINYLLIRNNVNYLTSECYEMVSGIYKVSPGSVERSVRNAITCAWQNYGKQSWKVQLFSTIEKKPTSREFINLIIEKMNIASNSANFGCL